MVSELNLEFQFPSDLLERVAIREPILLLSATYHTGEWQSWQQSVALFMSHVNASLADVIDELLKSCNYHNPHYYGIC